MPLQLPSPFSAPLNIAVNLSASDFTMTAVAKASTELLNPQVSSQSSVLNPSAAFDTVDHSLLFKHSSLCFQANRLPCDSHFFPVPFAYVP